MRRCNSFLPRFLLIIYLSHDGEAGDEDDHPCFPCEMDVERSFLNFFMESVVLFDGCRSVDVLLLFYACLLSHCDTLRAIYSDEKIKLTLKERKSQIGYYKSSILHSLKTNRQLSSKESFPATCTSLCGVRCLRMICHCKES